MQEPIRRVSTAWALGGSEPKVADAASFTNETKAVEADINFAARIQIR